MENKTEKIELVLESGILDKPTKTYHIIEYKKTARVSNGMVLIQSIDTIQEGDTKRREYDTVILNEGQINEIVKALKEVSK